jgi:sulfur carrier protein ThiS
MKWFINMKVYVKLFATYKQYMPPDIEGNVIETEVPPSTEVGELLVSYDIPVDQTSVLLVNGHTAEPGQVLEPEDVVSAFPAIAGG